MTPETNGIISTNQVRQILFNELGLTREYVRELVREIVTATIGQYFKSDHVKQFIAAEIDRMMRSYKYDQQALKRLVADGIADAVKKTISDKLTLRITGEL